MPTLKVIHPLRVYGCGILSFVCILGFLIIWNEPYSHSSAEATAVMPADLRVEDNQLLVTTNSNSFEHSTRLPLAVVVENHPDSRPQSGLSQADIIFETVAEGGITRYLAIFHDRTDVKIGPVRSARPYFVDIAESFGGVLAHVGGSPAALQKLKKSRDLLDVDEYFQTSVFERVKKRPAPHNTYTTTGNLFHFAEEKNYSAVNYYEYFPRSQDEYLVAAAPANHIAINFSKPGFLVTFTYDEFTKRYFRFVATGPDVDAALNMQLAPAAVIIQETDIDPIPGDKDLRVNIRTTGTGKAYIFQNGQMGEAFWSRKPDGKFEYFDSNNKAINLPQGQIWIAITEAGQIGWY